MISYLVFDIYLRYKNEVKISENLLVRVDEIQKKFTNWFAEAVVVPSEILNRAYSLFLFLEEIRNDGFENRDQIKNKWELISAEASFRIKSGLGVEKLTKDISKQIKHPYIKPSNRDFDIVIDGD